MEEVCLSANDISYHDEKQSLLRRLRRIEGQIKGIQRMIDEEKYCVDVLIQIAAAKAAINKVGLIIFENHTRGCVKSALASENRDKIINELTNVLKKFVK